MSAQGLADHHYHGIEHELLTLGASDRVCQDDADNHA
jgi:hypothetical protein